MTATAVETVMNNADKEPVRHGLCDEAKEMWPDARPQA